MSTKLTFTSSMIEITDRTKSKWQYCIIFGVLSHLRLGKSLYRMPFKTYKKQLSTPGEKKNPNSRVKESQTNKQTKNNQEKHQIEDRKNLSQIDNILAFNFNYFYESTSANHYSFKVREWTYRLSLYLLHFFFRTPDPCYQPVIINTYSYSTLHNSNSKKTACGLCNNDHRILQ